MPKRSLCFIISPIGDADSGVRDHADTVIEKLIEPALRLIHDKSGHAGPRIEAVRADHEHDAGNIMERVVRRILNDDVVIAVLFDRRANVYYELGIAHSAGRKVVLLRRADEKLPFDIGQDNSITYAPRHLKEDGQAEQKEVIHKLAEAIEKAIEADVRRVAFQNPDLDPLGRQHVRYAVLDRFNRDLPYAEYSEFFNGAGRFIALMGISLYDFTRRDNVVWTSPDGRQVSFVEFVQAKAIWGNCEVVLLILDEDNPALPNMLRASRAGVDPGELDRVRKEIRESARRWQEIVDHVAENAQDGRTGAIRLVKVREGTIHYRLSLTDRGAIVTPYFFRIGTNGGGPALKVAAGTSLYGAIREDLDYLVDLNRSDSEQPERRSIGSARP